MLTRVATSHLRVGTFEFFAARRDREALERLTVRRYLLGMVAHGVWWAGYILFPFVLGKSLAAPGWLVTVSVTMETTAMLAWSSQLMYWVPLRLARNDLLPISSFSSTSG